jgi:glycosyltransferase involved in cell wall biosynthesis
MTVSVVMAVLNGERFLPEALDSVFGQTRPPQEVIVVDGGSTDRSVAIAESYGGVRHIPQERSTGFAGAWDEGIADSDGDLVALLDSDDRWTPRKLEAQVALLERKPELDYVIGRVRFFLEPGYEAPASLRTELLAGDRIAPMPGAMLVRRSALQRVGPIATDYTIAADIDWFARAKDLLEPPGVIPEVVLEKRVHDANVSYFRAGALNRELLALLRDSVARKR